MYLLAVNSKSIYKYFIQDVSFLTEPFHMAWVENYWKIDDCILKLCVEHQSNNSDIVVLWTLALNTDHCTELDTLNIIATIPFPVIFQAMSHVKLHPADWRMIKWPSFLVKLKTNSTFIRKILTEKKLINLTRTLNMTKFIQMHRIYLEKIWFIIIHFIHSL